MFNNITVKFAVLQTKGFSNLVVFQYQIKLKAGIKNKGLTA